jgi:hypothetical protein
MEPRQTKPVAKISSDFLQTRLGIVIRINAGIAQGEKKGWLAQGFKSGS